MNISVRWLNTYLEPGDVTAALAEEVLTNVGFPIESAEPISLGDGWTDDTRLDVEVTSNRGDCLCHVGVAREIAAATGRRLVVPGVPAFARRRASDGGAIGCAVDNRAGDDCPMFTARVIRGVKVGPSPAWLARALESVGQRSINNVVDVTNWLTFELGQPSHVFDLSKVAGGKLVIRHAVKGEKLALLDGRTVTLEAGEVVVADASGGGGGGDGRPISLAGIMGGSETEVSGPTTDVLLEAATWSPLAVRKAARRLGIRTDASYRFERVVDPRTIHGAAMRAAALIVEVAGGVLDEGVIEASAGRVDEPLRVVELRPARCGAILGIDVPGPEIERVLRAHGIGVEPAGGVFRCEVPAHRPDLEREIDLIEEVARTHGLDELPIHDEVRVRIAPPQDSERAMRELAGALTGLGFFETVTFTFVSERRAGPFVESGLEVLSVCDERRRADGVLRPSVLPSLLACRKVNQDALVDAPGGVRLFEVSSVFAQRAGTSGEEGQVERVRLALIADAAPPPGAPGQKPFDQQQAAVRLVRGAIEAAARAVGGASAALTFSPLEAAAAGFAAGACAAVVLGGERIGTVGLIDGAVLADHDLALPVAAAEIDAAPLLRLFPPRATVTALPTFPGIERDLSLVVDEAVPWARIEGLVTGSGLDKLESLSFVGTYRGKQIGAGKKSVTLRVRFRDAMRTLRHEEVDPQMASLVDAAKREVGAEVRG